MLPRARFLAARPSSTAACGLLVNTARASRASCNLLPPSNLRLLLPRRSCSTKPGAKTDPFKGFSKDPTPSELPSDQTIAKRLEAGSDVPWTFALYGGVVGSLFSCSIALWNTQPATWFEILIPIPAFAICGYALGLAGLAHAKETPASKKLREQAEKKGASEPGGAFQMVGDKKLKEQAAKQEVGHVFHRIKTFLYKNRVAGFVAGAFFRTPVISAFKLMGTKMVLAGGSSGLLAMVGSVIVFACSVVEFDSSYFESDDGVKPALPLEPSPLPNNNLRTLAEAEIPLPAWWTMQKRSDVSCHLVDVTSDRNLKSAIERGLHHTAHAVCKGRDGTSIFRNAKIVSIHRIENWALWKQYWHRKDEMLDHHKANGIRLQPLDPPAKEIILQRDDGNSSVPPAVGGKLNRWKSEEGRADGRSYIAKNLNECYLYHGTSAEVASIISKHGFDERVGNVMGLYGAGVYFANQSCKAGQYTEKGKDNKTMIISRVMLGDPFYIAGKMQQARRPPDRKKGPVGTTYDSVVANQTQTQIHREFIIYEHRQAYPEYIIVYREQ